MRAGGGVNHRGSLSDGILVKDNHLAGISIEAPSPRPSGAGPGWPCEVECDTLDQVKEALDAGADMVLLDNMDPSERRPRPCSWSAAGSRSRCPAG